MGHAWALSIFGARLLRELLETLLRADALEVFDPALPRWLTKLFARARQQSPPAARLVQRVGRVVEEFLVIRNVAVTRLRESSAPRQQSDRAEDPSRRAAVRATVRATVRAAFRGQAGAVLVRIVGPLTEYLLLQYD